MTPKEREYAIRQLGEALLEAIEKLNKPDFQGRAVVFPALTLTGRVYVAVSEDHPR